MICVVCSKEFHHVVIVNGKRKNILNRLQCLECNPFKSHKRYSAIGLKTTKKCNKCGVEKSKDEFYKRRENKGISSQCKECFKELTNELQRDWKIKAVEYKGGKCVRCGYNKCVGALDFHHEDPATKEYALGSGRKRNFESMKSELDKCVLLCSNCHREEHYQTV